MLIILLKFKNINKLKRLRKFYFKKNLLNNEDSFLDIIYNFTINLFIHTVKIV